MGTSEQKTDDIVAQDRQTAADDPYEQSTAHGYEPSVAQRALQPHFFLTQQ